MRKVQEKVDILVKIYHNVNSVDMNSDYIKSSGFKTGVKFGAYFYVGVTIASLCIRPFIFISVPYLNSPFALLISKPIAWIMLGAIFVVVSGLVVSVAKSLFYLNSKPSKDLVNTDDLDSGSHFVNQTNRGNYCYWLSNSDIIAIANIEYGYILYQTCNGVFFCYVGSLSGLDFNLKKYKNKVEQENLKEPFISVIFLNGNHFVTLAIVYEQRDKKFRAYYCDALYGGLTNTDNKCENIGKYKDKMERIEEIREIINSKRFPKDLTSLQANEKQGKNNIQKELSILSKEQENLSTISTNDIVSALLINLGNCSIESSQDKRQNDTHNCAIFVLDDIKKIADMLSKHRSFNEISEELFKCKPNSEQLQEKRRNFAEKIMNDFKEQKENLVTTSFLDIPEPPLRIENISQVKIL